MHSFSLAGARIFDGEKFLDAQAVTVSGGRIAEIGPAQSARVDLDGGVLLPGFVDLQINGAGGIQIGAGLTVEDIAHVCATQARLGATACLPTLITDAPEATVQVLAAGMAAARAKVPGFLGLHLEGPHIDPRKKGAHDAALIRPMNEMDVSLLLEAASQLTVLMVTLAPEAATADQIRALAQAGIIVSLGHSDCSAQTANAAFAKGARCVTHLFNAMSQLGSREPGLVGAALGGEAWCGLIADAIHVDPLAIRVALEAKRDNVFLVSDCMALAGTDATSMLLGGRRISRSGGRLTLDDGTLAGADLTLSQAVATLVYKAGIAPERALAMTGAIPARAVRCDDRHGFLAPGRQADLVHLRDDWTLAAVWQNGKKLT